MGLLDGKVALITGAGGGLGRAHALQFAEEGAKVVVNDLGSTLDGDGESHNLADTVVSEIEELGGEAVADYGSVSDEDEAEAMVQRAIEEFGQIDVVVNNAGILRDKTLAKMTNEMWDAVIDVHLTGTFLVTRAAFRAMSDQDAERGRIINTTSLAGLLGNFGQTNYSAAKAGIAGITRTVALEGRRSGITVNAIAPVAKTRMTEDIEAVPEALEPEDVSPLVTWLASDASDDVTGRIFGAHGSHYFEYETEQTPGVDLGDERWTPAQVGERFEEIEAMPEAASEETSDEQTRQVEALFQAMPETLRAQAAGAWSATIQFVVEGTGHYVIDVDDGSATFASGEADDATGKVTFDSAKSLLAMAAGELQPEQAFMSGTIASDNMDLLMKFGKLFDLEEAADVLGGGGSDDSDDAAGDGLNRDMLGEKYKQTARFVKAPEMIAYADATENDNPRHVDSDREGGIIAPPLFAQKLLHDVLSEALSDERLNADLLRLVHGEQDMRFHRPLEPWDLVAARAEIASITDKSSGQLLEIDQWLVCEGEVVTEATSGLFIRAADGGSSSSDTKKTSASNEPTETPDRDIIHEAAQFVAEDQPVRYAEASGDHNPIHTDPNVAESAGLPGVILHGMCTMAFASNAIVGGVLDGDARRLRRLRVRFAKPVFPEQTITTRIWKAGRTDDRRVQLGFEAANDDGTVVLSQGIAEIEE